jgi:hypothetical protein
MPRRPVEITQADVARVVRAAKQAGAAEVVVLVNGKSKMLIRLVWLHNECERFWLREREA